MSTSQHIEGSTRVVQVTAIRGSGRVVWMNDWTRIWRLREEGYVFSAPGPEGTYGSVSFYLTEKGQEALR